MSINNVNPYDQEPYMAILADDIISNMTDDVRLIKELILENRCNVVLEPFCGTGRILIPLAKEGLEVTGIDSSKVMLDIFADKVRSEDIDSRVGIVKNNVVDINWPRGNDAIILGMDCLYELGSYDEHRTVIEKAYKALNEGGYLFIDSYKKDLPRSWFDVRSESPSFPTGSIRNNIELRGYMETVYLGENNNLIRSARRVEVFKEGQFVRAFKWMQQKRLVRYEELMKMVKDVGFDVVSQWSDYKKKSFNQNSDRLIMWLKK